jgi:hypothetical protein
MGVVRAEFLTLAEMLGFLGFFGFGFFGLGFFSRGMSALLTELPREE